MCHENSLGQITAGHTSLCPLLFARLRKNNVCCSHSFSCHLCVHSKAWHLLTFVFHALYHEGVIWASSPSTPRNTFSDKSEDHLDEEPKPAPPPPSHTRRGRKSQPSLASSSRDDVEKMKVWETSANFLETPVLLFSMFCLATCCSKLHKL